jgi:hypothetical protein
VLKEILAGHASDPPGMSFYCQQLDAKGEPKFDSLGLSLYYCNRGTNDTENVHKQIVTTFGTWNVGVEMSDCLMAEWRHRFNQRISERRRLGFPKLGHYDTWLVDQYQLLVLANHNVLAYPGWTNASDFVDTPESFGTVPLHSPELGDAIAAIVLSEAQKTEIKLTREMRYICKSMKVKLPILPVHGEAENKLFSKLVLNQHGTDFDRMSIEWCKHVDGVAVFPKLPVYLRQHHAAWLRNSRTRDMVRMAAPGLTALQKVLDANVAMVVAPPPAESPTTSPAAPPTPVESPPTSPDALSPPTVSTLAVVAPAPVAVAVVITPLVAAAVVIAPLLTHTMASAPMRTSGDEATVVGGMVIGESISTRLAPPSSKRGGDKKPRLGKRCRSCIHACDTDANARLCLGRHAGITSMPCPTHPPAPPDWPMPKPTTG